MQGHFQLTSGLHSAEYLQSALVMQHPRAAERLGQLLADQLRPPAVGMATLVVSPALGGMIIGHEVARALGGRHIFTERDPATGKMTMRRGFAVKPDDRVVVVEDVITTGGTTKDVIAMVRQAGAEVLRAACIIDRSGGRADVGLPRVSLVTMQVAAHYPSECPLCAQGIPAVKPGSRPA